MHARQNVPSKVSLAWSAFPLAAFATSSVAFANTAIETETAQIGNKGDIGTSNSVELEKATDGFNVGTLTQFEYGISDRSEILIEPFFYQLENPTDGPLIHGSGDLEVTPSYEFITEKQARPSVLIAFKLKVPVGSAPDFSTGKFDYYPYFIVGQHFLGLTFNGNIGVNFVTPVDPNGTFTETVVWDLELERDLGPNKHWTVFAEVFSAEEAIFTGSAAIQYNLNETTKFFVASSYDVEGSFVVRPGINFDFVTRSEESHRHRLNSSAMGPSPVGQEQP